MLSGAQQRLRRAYAASRERPNRGRSQTQDLTPRASRASYSGAVDPWRAIVFGCDGADQQLGDLDKAGAVCILLGDTRLELEAEGNLIGNQPMTQEAHVW